MTPVDPIAPSPNVNNFTEVFGSQSLLKTNNSVTWVQLGISVMNLFYVTIIVTVSLRVNKKDLCRLCTLWQFLTHGTSDVFQIIISVIQLSGKVASSKATVLGSGWNIISIIGRVLQSNAAQVYRIMALLLVFLTYLSHKHPFFYFRMFKHAKRNTMFIYGFMFVCLHSIIANATNTASEKGISFESTGTLIVLLFTFYILQLVMIAPVFLMIVLYVMSLHAIIKYARKKARRGESTVPQQKQLASVVLYSTAPNILLIPPTIQNICYVILAHFTDGNISASLLSIINVIDVVSRCCVYARMPVLTVSTFLAFSPYRKALLSYFGQGTRPLIYRTFSKIIFIMIHEPRIVNVWKENLQEEFDKILYLLEDYKFVAMDTEFPGVATVPREKFARKEDFNLNQVVSNANLLKLIQVGLVIMNDKGELPPGNNVWQFNFQFSKTNDLFVQDSIDLLEQVGIDFDRHEIHGIDSVDFAELLTSSGFLCNNEITWITFHGAYDFSYLLRCAMMRNIPSDPRLFSRALKIYFPRSYDLKVLTTTKRIPLHGSLKKVAEILNIERCGTQHQAGPDALLTAQAFFKVRRLLLSHEWEKVVKTANRLIYGLGDTLCNPWSF
ncbi:hypothetical protein QR680_019333 [Steinernema hermaphroditum]|uniref:poly(A)-specific ribonuclease n=1 Tax=Steinernema hermaphroditum TaxID=289476 RepID=A0AA39LAZ3_9BILA|nr:hypothetical protein QR680_019333 [Steinernema hermaphroditum]